MTPPTQGEPRTVLVAMPFALLHIPSIQIGTLTSVLAGAGIPARPLSLHLAFAEAMVAAGLSISDYQHLAYGPEPLIEWIFAVAPFRADDPEADARYLDGLRRAKADNPPLVDLAVRAREQVVPFLDRWADSIVAGSPAIVGFTTTFVQTIPSLALAQRIKARSPSTQIVFGGGNCDGSMGEALHRAFPFVDHVVRGDGERVVPQLFADLLAAEPPSPLAGLCSSRGGDPIAVPQSAEALPAMAEVPLPDYDEYFARLESSGLRDTLGPLVEIPFESARGCWWGQRSHCTFCGLNGTSMAYRSKPPERTAAEIEQLARRYHHLKFRAVDNIIDFDYLGTLLPRLKSSGWDLEFFYETKANLKKSQLRLMRDAGLTRIQPGLESLSTKITRLMRKGVTALQNIRLLKWGAELGIEIVWNVIYGIPGEPVDEYARMAKLVPRLHHLTPPVLCHLALERFSPYHRDPETHGIEILGPGGGRNANVYPGVDDATLLDLAHTFRYRLTRGPSVETYIGPLRDAIDTWSARRAAQPTLRHARGPGFLSIVDRRDAVDGATYTLAEPEASIYLACDAGATPDRIARELSPAGLDADDIRTFLDSLVEEGLMFEENGVYLSLSTPLRPEADDPALDDAVEEAPASNAPIPLRRTRAS